MLKALGVMLVSMLVLDLIWIQLVMKQLYQNHVAHLLREVQDPSQWTRWQH